ncbi:tetratricopeptide repeat protein [Aquirufa sp. 5-AUSEE-100C1]|jgi:Tfp pilus assembly protein PilF
MKKMKSWLLGVGLLLTNLAFGQTIQEGLHMLDRHQPSRAKQVFESLVAAQPTGENYFYLGYYYLNQRDWDNARKTFEAGKAADPKNYLNQVGLASILVGQNKVNEAKVDFDRILAETKNKNIDVMYRIAEAYTMYYILGKEESFNAANNDPAEAIRLIDAIQDRMMKDKKLPTAEHYIVKGDAFLIKNDGGNAVTAYENAIAQEPRNIKAKVKIGTVYLRGKNYKETQSRYKEAIDLDSNYAPALRKYGEYLIVGSQYKNASRYFRRYLERAEATPQVTLETAKLLFLSKDYEGAMKFTDEADKKGVKDNDIYRMRGYSNVEMGKFQEGIDNLDGMVKSGVKPYFMDDLYFGKGYQGLGKDSLAIVYLERAAPLDTNNNVYSIIHDVRYKQKRYADAAVAGMGAIQWKVKKAQTVGSGDYFKVAMDYYLTAAFMNKADTVGRPAMAMRADTLFAKALQINDKWPPFYINRARANNLIDYTGTKWLGAPYYEKFLAAVETQRAEKGQYKEDKNQLFEAYKFLGGYNLSVTKDEAKVKELFTKAQEIKADDPDIKAYFNPTPAPTGAPAAPKK